MVGISLNFDLHDYIHEIRHYKNVAESLKKLKKYGPELEDEFLDQFKEVERGEMAYGEVGCIDPSIARNGQATIFFTISTIKMK